MTTEYDLNRWEKYFGTDEHSKSNYLEYLSKRFWKVRGERIEISKGERKSASNSYLKSLIKESGYWTGKHEVLFACKEVDSNSRVADDYTYIPIAEQTIKNNDGTQVLFNTYQSPNLAEIEPTDEELKLWNSFWVHLLTNEDERYRVQQWLSHIAFRPEQITGVAILLHGQSTGTGKGTLGEMMTELVGHSNTVKPMNALQSLCGRFNAAFDGNVLFIIDELYQGGNFTLANGVKSKITEPTLEVEAKGKEMHKIDNYCNFYATSNNLTPLWLDDKDRRWEIYRVEYTDSTKEQHQKAVGEFRYWFESDREHAVSVIRYILNSIDISEYKPWSDGAVITEAKQKLISNSVSTKEDDFNMHWQNNSYDDCSVVNTTVLFCEEWKKTSSGQRSEILTNLGCKRLDNTGNVQINGVQHRNWWITPKGLKLGLNIYMNGKELGDAISKLKNNNSSMDY